MRRRRSAGAVQDAGDGVGVGDDLEDTHAAAAFSAAGDVEREDAGEELCPADASWSGRGFGRVAGEGEVQRELWRRRCGGLGDDVLAQAMVAGEHAVVAGHVEAGRRNQGAEAGEELVGVHVGVGGAAAPGRLERDADAAAGERRDGVVGEGRAQEVAADSLELLAVAAVGGGRGVEIHAEGGEGHRRRPPPLRAQALRAVPSASAMAMGQGRIYP
jgi:hypothetical protein